MMADRSRSFSLKSNIKLISRFDSQAFPDIFRVDHFDGNIHNIHLKKNKLAGQKSLMGKTQINMNSDYKISVKSGLNSKLNASKSGKRSKVSNNAISEANRARFGLHFPEISKENNNDGASKGDGFSHR